MDYNLYIVYLFADTGKKAAPTVMKRFKPGENFCIRSPKIPGYTYNHNVINGIISPKRERPISKIVLYDKDENVQSQSDISSETSSTPVTTTTSDGEMVSQN